MAKNKKNISHLTELLSQFSTDMTDIQQQLDQQFEEDRQQYEKLVAQTPIDARPFLIPLAPKRQRINQHEVTARLQFQKEKSTSGQLRVGVQLLNFSADLRYQRNTAHDCEISFLVESRTVIGEL